ncbi:MAG TPA: DUF1289 domain-containing protein [Rubrivivax sp.]|nr:DUF1289 domain-containing protein [Rubrivivax sp.]
MRGAQHEGSPVTPQTAVPSPCINVCRMDAASGLCEGCQRTLVEIGAWASMGDAQKREVWRQLEQRRKVGMPSQLETRKDCP